MVSAGAEGRCGAEEGAEVPGATELQAEAEKAPEKQEEVRKPSEDAMLFDSRVEVDSVTVCGMDLRVLRRRGDFFAACAGDLPMRSTGTVLWECGVLLADYLGYARWVRPGDCVEDEKDAGTEGKEKALASDAAKEASPHPWWMTHPPAPVVPSRFWSSQPRKVLELGGGCGLVTAVLAGLGAEVVCSDCDPAALRTARRNCCEAKNRYGCGAHSTWGSTDFRELRWGDAAAAKRLAQECGPFGFIVGSDLLYGDVSPPEPLLETLAALASEPNSRDAEVVIAAKSRCADEADRFCSLARAKGLWSVHLGEHGDFVEGYEDTYKPSDDGAEVPAYNVFHLRPLPAGAEGPAAEPSAKRQRV